MSDSRRNGSHSLYQQNQRIFKKAIFRNTKDGLLSCKRPPFTWQYMAFRKILSFPEIG